LLKLLQSSSILSQLLFAQVTYKVVGYCRYGLKDERYEIPHAVVVVVETRDKLEERYRKLFVPGQQLSLDKTLIRAFGRIKFKVHFVTNAARYRIKIYVITDAATAFVLRVVFYTGKSTYYAEVDAVVAKKTVQVVNRLVEWYKDLHRTIYVNWFYTFNGLESGGKEFVRHWNKDGELHPARCSDCQDVASVQKNEER
jgi:Transposase IS4